MKNLKTKSKTDLLKKQNGIPSGEPVFLDFGGILHRFDYDCDLFMGNRFSQRLRSEQGWFEKMVTHAPSVGTFYEDALRSIVSEILPSSLKIGTGFIFDSLTRMYSKQIDILVYDDSLVSPLYRRGQFVVVAPSQVVSASEVKKSLTLKDIRNIISSTIASNFGRHPSDPPGCNRICVFSYSSNVKTDKIYKCVFDEITKYLNTLYFEERFEDSKMRCITCLVLPRFFFFDRVENIAASLTVNSEGKCMINVSEHSGGALDGLGGYLDAMVIERFKKTDPDRRTFFSLPIQNVNRREVISHRAPLIQQISMLKLCEIFSDEKDDIIKFRPSSKKVYMALLPPCIDVAAFKSFSELTNDSRVGWLVP